ncbi:MAG: hypothetical protein RDV48_15025 [Candidatus Eremiobacteraeota bacterium]|nr:hypothetical protein [Candidatus Eremiobacteraeota bacterium]
MPYYGSGSRKTAQGSRNSGSTRKNHRRECLVDQSRKTDHSKETIREVTLKLMAMMKAKRECQTEAG